MRGRLARIILGLILLSVLVGLLVRGCAKSRPPKMTAPPLPALTVAQNAADIQAA